MKKSLSVSLCLIIISLLVQKITHAQCKPDLKEEDKISGAENIVWETSVWETSFGSSLGQDVLLGSATNLSMRIQIGHYGSTNLISLFITKSEGSNLAANFESLLKADQQSQVILAFEGMQEPYTFGGLISNNTDYDKLFGEYVTKVTISKTINIEDLEIIKSYFKDHEVKAIRVLLSGTQKLEQEIKTNKASKIQDKFNCFFEYVEQNPNLFSNTQTSTTASQPADLSVVNPSDYTSTIVGNWTYEVKGNKYQINFGSDGKYSAYLSGNQKVLDSGSWTILGDRLITADNKSPGSDKIVMFLKDMLILNDGTTETTLSRIK